MVTLPGDQVIVVSGLPRSGTSLMMQLLDKAGLDLLTDQIRKSDIDNQRGYYEYEPVKQIKSGHVGWMAKAKGKAIKIISYSLFYLPGDYKYKVIFMLRSLPEIVASQNLMLSHRGEQENQPIAEAELVRVFSNHLKEVSQWLRQQSNINTVFVDYNKLVRNPGTTVRPLESFLGLPLSRPDILALVDSELYRQRAAG